MKNQALMWWECTHIIPHDHYALCDKYGINYNKIGVDEIVNIYKRELFSFTLQKLGMIKLNECVYAKVVSKGRCTRQFNEIRKEIGGEFSYICINQNEPEKTDGYDISEIKINWSEENLIILKF